MLLRSSLLTTAIALLAPAVSALPLSFSSGPSLTVVGGYAQTAPLAALIGLTNTGPLPLMIGVERQIRAEVSGSENNFCFGVGCYPPNVSVAPQPISLTAGATDNSFIGDYLPNGQAGVTRIRYAFYDFASTTGQATDTAYVTVTFDASQRVTGLAAELAASFLLSAPVPNPVTAGTDVLLILAADAPRAATVRLVDLRDGRTVRTISCGPLSWGGMLPPTPTGGGDPAVGSGPRGSNCGGTPPPPPPPTIAVGGCYSPGEASPSHVVRLSTAGLAAGVYGCLLVDERGRGRALRRLVVQ